MARRNQDDGLLSVRLRLHVDRQTDEVMYERMRGMSEARASHYISEIIAEWRLYRDLIPKIARLSGGTVAAAPVLQALPAPEHTSPAAPRKNDLPEQVKGNAKVSDLANKYGPLEVDEF